MIPKDKTLHFTISAILTIVLGMFLGFWWGVVLTLLIGIGKEVIWDYLLGKGCPDLADINADLGGVAVGTFLLICL